MPPLIYFLDTHTTIRRVGVKGDAPSRPDGIRSAPPAFQKLRVELEDLIEQLSKLAEAKRMYGSVRPAPGAHRAGHAPRRPDATGEGRQAGATPPGAAADAQGAWRDQQQQQQQQSAGHGGQQRLGPEDEAALLQRADECSTRCVYGMCVRGRMTRRKHA